MKYKPLTTIKYQRDNMSSDSIKAWLKYQRENQFSVGDYLIKKIKNHEFDRWDIELFNDKSQPDVYRKYVVLKIDDLGIPYVAPIICPGAIGKHAIPLTNVDLNYERFELDPDYETYLLLDRADEYDPLERWRYYFKKSAQELNDMFKDFKRYAKNNLDKHRKR